MVDLTRHLIELLQRPVNSIPPHVAYNLGRAALRFKQPTRALKLLSYAVDSTKLPAEIQLKAVQHLITAARRAELYDIAATHTEDLALALEESDPLECRRLLRLALRYRRKMDQTMGRYKNREHAG